MPSTEADDVPLTRLDELLAEYMGRLDRGEPPDPEGFIAEHPAFADGLRAYFRDCQLLGPPTTPAPPRPFDYEILEEIGRGGMGVVFKARQVSLNRLVALKLIRGGTLASAEERRRFRAEAETAALLDHPHVVPIYEVGEYLGEPFLSMRLIDGGTLAGRAHDADFGRVARLVTDLADAVEHAHRHGVLHRDLKPANVLLDAGGRAYISDFGLAKRFGADNDLSQSGTVVGTPMYMAPEQARGRTSRLTTATDVYGLGAILYECLTGRPPFRGDSVVQTLTMVVGAEPEPAGRHRRGVPRDLDVICLKCLEKDPARRYPTAGAVADDLRRFVRGEPIQARPVGAVERAWRWARRHPVLSMAAGFGVLLLVAVTAFAVQTIRAAARAEASYEAADKVYASFAAWREDHPGLDADQRELAEWLRGMYERFAREDGRTPAMRHRIARANFRLGEIRRSLNDPTAADAYGLAIAALEELAARYPSEPAYREDLAECHNWLGEVRRTAGRDVAGAERAYRAALALQTELAEADPEEPRYRRLQARSLFNRGIVEMDTGRRDEAHEHYRRAIGLLEPLAGPDGEPGYRHELARCRINLGLLLHEDGKGDRAESELRAAVEALRRLTRGPRVTYRLELAVACNALGNLLADKGDPKAARAAYAEALALTSQLVVFFPARPEYRRELGQAHNNLGAVAWAKENPAPAREHWRQAREQFAALVADHPDTAEYHALLGQAVGNLGWLHSEEGKPAEACGYFEDALRAYTAARTMNPDHPGYLRGQRSQYQSLAEMHLQRKEYEKAAAAAEALAGDPREGQSCYFAACFLARCAAGAAGEAARGYADRAVGSLRRAAEAGFCDAKRVEKDRPEVFQALAGRADFEDVVRRFGP